MLFCVADGQRQIHHSRPDSLLAFQVNLIRFSLLDLPSASVEHTHVMEASLLLPTAKTISSDQLFNNFILFSTSFSLVHATVDGVLVYATAELGPLLGGISGGLLYICYAFSSAFLAKNVLFQLKARRAVLFGMVCLLTYVSTFLLALAVPSIKWAACVIGAITGGFGAGIMWTAQGSYYTLNSSLYLIACSDITAFDDPNRSSIVLNNSASSSIFNSSEVKRSIVLNQFAGYFAAIYLCSEAACKMLITGLFLVLRSTSGSDDDGDDDSKGQIGSWQVISFFAFTLVAWTSTAFAFGILDLSTIKQDYETELTRASLLQRTISEGDTICTSSCETRLSSEESNPTTAPAPPVVPITTFITSFKSDFSAVLSFIRDHDSFRYLLPYQFSFGFSSTYMGFLIYGIILNDNGKEGYIGLLSALSVLFAGGLAIPIATYTNRPKRHRKGGGKSATLTNVHTVMISGAAIFALCAGFPLYLSDETVASWPVIVPLVCIYGAGRSIWENSNKALIANIFATTHDSSEGADDDEAISSFRMSISSINEGADEEKSPQESSHERAFAAIYFISGMGAAIGFFTFKFFTTMTIAALTAGVGFVALVSNHYFFMYCQDADKK